MRLIRKNYSFYDGVKDAILTRDWLEYDPRDLERVSKVLSDAKNPQELFNRKNVKYRLPLVGVGGVTGLLAGDLVGEEILRRFDPKSNVARKGILWGSRIAGTSAGVLGGDMLGKRLVRGAAKRTIGLDVKK